MKPVIIKLRCRSTEAPWFECDIRAMDTGMRRWRSIGFSVGPALSDKKRDLQYRQALVILGDGTELCVPEDSIKDWAEV